MHLKPTITALLLYLCLSVQCLAQVYTITVTYTTIGCSETKIQQVGAACCTSTDSVLNFAGGTSTAFLQQIAGQYPGNVSGTSLSNLNQDIFIQGIITLNNNLTITGCPHLIFAPQAGILVSGGYSLRLYSDTLYACSDTMWQGIEVTGTGSMVYTKNTTGSNTMIRDARKAIYSHNNAKDSILDCVFTNNWYGIYLDGTAGIPLFSVIGSTFNTNLLAYGALKFDVIDNPHPLYAGYSYQADVGVFIKSAPGTRKATVGSMTGAINKFLYINCGVLDSVNSLEVVHSYFDSLPLPPTGPFLNNHPYNKPYLGRAIYVRNPFSQHTNYTLKVGDYNPAGADTIGLCWRGLDELGNSGKVQVLGNRITSALNTALYIGPDRSPGIRVAYNTIDVTGTHHETQTGIYLSGNNLGSDSIHANTLVLIDPLTYTTSSSDTGAATGIAVINSGAQVIITAAANHIVIDSNIINRVQKGIYTLNSRGILITKNNINLWPIPWSVGAKSYWAGITSVADWFSEYITDNLIDGNPYGAANSTYTPDDTLRGKLIGIYTQSPQGESYVRCNGIQNTHWCIANAGTNTQRELLTNNRFFGSTAGVSLFANGYLGPQGTISTTNDNEWDATSMQRSMGVYNVSNFNVLNSPFYLRGINSSIYNPNLAQQPVSPSLPFPINIVNSPFNSIVSCPLPIPTFNGTPFAPIQVYIESIALDTIHFSSDSADNIKWAQESLISSILQDSTLLDSSRVLADYYKAATGNGYKKLMQVFYGMQNDTDATNLTTYQALNNAASTPTINEQNLKTITNLYLRYFLTPSDTVIHGDTLMTPSDLNTTYNIASQCYISGGPAVFLARGMYWSALRDNSIQFGDDCITNSNGDKVRREQQSQVIDTIKWMQLTPCPDTNQLIAFGYFLIDSDFYVAGGEKHGTFSTSSHVWRYHIPTDVWQRMSNLPFGPASAASSFVFNGQGYFLTSIDSINHGNCDKMLWKYDPLSDSWARMADFPDSPREYNSTFMSGDKGYTGQTIGCSRNDNHFWQYDPTLNQWYQIASLPTVQTSSSSAIGLQSLYAYLMGGMDQSVTFYNTVWKYNISTNTWFDIGVMPISRVYPVIWKFDSILIVGGGEEQDTNRNVYLANDFYKYNILQGSWTPVIFENSFDSTADGATFVYNKKGYYFGGESSVSQYSFSNKLWSFDASKYITDTTHVGIQEVQPPYQFKVYPNPMSEKTSLNVQCSESGEIVFYNLLGQVTYQSKLKVGVNTFDCLQLSCNENVILYHATMRSGKIETGKIVTLR